MQKRFRDAGLKFLWMALLGMMAGCAGLNLERDSIDTLIDSNAIRVEKSTIRGSNYKIVMPTTAPATILTPLLGSEWDVKNPQDRDFLLSEIIRRKRTCEGADFNVRFIDATRKIEFVSTGRGENQVSVYHAYIYLQCEEP